MRAYNPSGAPEYSKSRVPHVSKWRHGIFARQREQSSYLFLKVLAVILGERSESKDPDNLHTRHAARTVLTRRHLPFVLIPPQPFGCPILRFFLAKGGSIIILSCHPERSHAVAKSKDMLLVPLRPRRGWPCGQPSPPPPRTLINSYMLERMRSLLASSRRFAAKECVRSTLQPSRTITSGSGSAW